MFWVPLTGMHIERRGCDPGAKAGCAAPRRDTPVLCMSLTYAQGLPEVLEGTPLAAGRAYSRVYAPPFDEFEVARVSIPATAHSTPVGMQESLPKSPVRMRVLVTPLPWSVACMQASMAPARSIACVHPSHLQQHTGSVELPVMETYRLWP